MKKALLIRLSSLGDIIFNLPLANVLKNNGYEVTWIVSEKGIDIVKDNPVVHKSILIPIKQWKKNGFCLKNFCEFLKILKEIRAEKYDIAIDTQMMFKSFIWMKLCRAKRKICTKHGKEFSSFGGNEVIDPIPNPNFSKHIVFHHLWYAKYLGLENPDDVKFSLPPTSQETKNKVDNLLKNLDKTKPMVVISPATTWKLKHWNKDNWKAVDNNIQNDCSVVFTVMECDK